MLNIDAETVAQRLRASRRAADIDQAEIARTLGVARTTVSNWERGVFEPSVSQFIAWARITRQPVERLIDGLPGVADVPGTQKSPGSGRALAGASYTPRDLNPEPTD